MRFRLRTLLIVTVAGQVVLGLWLLHLPAFVIFMFAAISGFISAFISTLLFYRHFRWRATFTATAASVAGVYSLFLILSAGSPEFLLAFQVWPSNGMKASPWQLCRSSPQWSQPPSPFCVQPSSALSIVFRLSTRNHLDSRAAPRCVRQSLLPRLGF